MTTRFRRIAFFLSMALYAVTAWFSEGYHHPDEHFQVIELANYKLGGTSLQELPWEYEAQIRPGLQPALAYAIIRAAQALGISDPFFQVFLMRLLSGVLACILFFAWARRLDAEDKNAGDALRWMALLLWFVPYLSVRFSSENMAGLSFVAGALLLLQGLEKQGWKVFVAGFLLGLSFFFRYQMGFALAGLAVWLLWHSYQIRAGIRPILWLFSGFVAACIPGFAADIWLYGTYTFAPYNYFISNIVDNKAAYWGTSPWWYYLEQTVLTATPLVGLLLLLLLVNGLRKKRDNVLVWSLMPFLLAHFVVGHKEMRFMYPMLLPILVLAAWGWADGRSRLTAQKRLWRWVRPLVVVTLVVNCLLLPVRSLLAAQESVACFHFLYRYAEKNPVTVYSHKKLLYESVGLNMNFYRSPNIHNIMYLNVRAKNIPAGSLLLSQDLILKNPPPGAQTTRLYAYFPEWILKVNVNDWQSRTRMWSLYRVLSRKS
ncbi:MAG: hypothetical protein LCH81_11710 [Bacteroidetes bacterium]|nr:hypothetical protein [Bacteroidota bacterium]